MLLFIILQMHYSSISWRRGTCRLWVKLHNILFSLKNTAHSFINTLWYWDTVFKTYKIRYSCFWIYSHPRRPCHTSQIFLQRLISETSLFITKITSFATGYFRQHRSVFGHSGGKKDINSDCYRSKVTISLTTVLVASIA